MNDRSDEEADNLPPADDRNFYKVEKGSKDGTKVERMLYAGSNLRQGHQASATDQANDQAKNTRVAAVAGYRSSA